MAARLDSSSSTFCHVDDVVDLCRDVGASHTVIDYLTLATCPLEY
ncbi:MAG TPA: hypothetical protein VIK32_00160 [Candidatus Limnocylindrales bacterium]